MTTSLPIFAALAAVLSLWASGPHKRRGASALAYGAVLGLFAICMLAVFKIRPPLEAQEIAKGYAIGALIAAAASLATVWAGSFPGKCATALGWGAAGASAIHWLHLKDADLAQMSLLVGCGLSALILDLAEGSAASLAALAALAVVACDLLGLLSVPAKAPGQAGGMIGATAAALCLGAVLVDRFGTVWIKRLGPILLILPIIGVGKLLGTHWKDLADAYKVLAYACAAALAVHWMFSAEAPNGALRLGLATVVWCTLATLAYGILESFGVALALGGASATLFVLANPRGLTSLAPLATLTFYRIFRTGHIDAYAAVDIGEHYALVGFTIGAVGAMLPLEWLRSLPAPQGRKALAGMFVWSLYMLAMPALVALMLGSKGIIGFLVGLGLSSLIVGVKEKGSIGVLSLVASLGGLTILLYVWMADYLDLSREDKLHDFKWAAAAVVLGGLLLSWLARAKKAEVAA